MNMANRIQYLRKTNGMSQEELADRMGVSRQAVSKWESEQSTPDLEKIIIMSELFGVTTDYSERNRACCVNKQEKYQIHILGICDNLCRRSRNMVFYSEQIPIRGVFFHYLSRSGCWIWSRPYFPGYEQFVYE